MPRPRRPLALSAVALALAACGSSGAPAGHWDGPPGAAPSAGAPDAATPWPRGSGGATSDAGAPLDATTAPDAPSPPRCTGKTGQTGDRALTLQLGAESRTLLVHVPPSYDPTRPTPLVVNFHGYTMTDAQQANVSQMAASSDAHGFLVAFPQGVGNSWNAGDCCGQATQTNEDDLGFFKAILANLEGDYCVDAKRVYAAGFSNGGFFSHRLACEMADVVAAVAPVSGVLGMPPENCHPSRPVPVLEFHGTGDLLVPYDGGTPLSGGLDFGPIAPHFRSVAETNQAWRDRDGCLGTGSTVYQQGDATCVSWACAAGSEVELCTIDQGGHTWPGGRTLGFAGEGKLSTSIDASEHMAAFFARHALP